MVSVLVSSVFQREGKAANARNKRHNTMPLQGTIATDAKRLPVGRPFAFGGVEEYGERELSHARALAVPLLRMRLD